MANPIDTNQPDHIEEVLEMVTDTNQASEDELQPFTSLFQNAAVARDYVTGCVSEEDINELAAHIFFIEPTYKYDISKAPIDNVFSAYRIAVEALITADRKRIKELGLEQAQEIYNSVQKEKVEKQKAVSENEKIREMLNDPEVIGKAVKGAIKAQRKMAGLESEEN